MRLRVLAVVAVLGVVAGVGLWVGSSPKTTRFTSEECGFVVTFPASPSPTVEHKEQPGGIRSIVTGVLTPRAGYTVTLSRLPAEMMGLLKELPPEEFLVTMSANASANLGDRELRGSLMSHGPTGVPAREFVVVRGNAFFRGRTIVAGDKVYNVVVGGNEAFVSGIDATDFLDSFELVK